MKFHYKIKSVSQKNIYITNHGVTTHTHTTGADPGGGS
jgi:hypothetical protein